jgi:aspartyl-tRNA(Asn)/glutamyl-tRNA(Gln) amidotransferase subunit B
VRYEIGRHAAVLTSGGTIVQETRHWHEDTGVTTSGRVKSDADDYRYFPEPDLVPVAPSRSDVDALRGTLPEPPAARRKRLQADWGFADLEMRDVVNAGLVELVEETVAAGASPAAARKWWSGEVARRANAEGEDVPTFAAGLGVGPASVVELERLVTSGRLNDGMARQVWEGVLSGEGSPTAVADARGLALSQDTGALEAAVDAVIAANPDVADKIRDGKVQAVGALIGQVMREMKGQGDAAAARELILARLGQG